MKAIVIGFGEMGMLHAATLRMLGVDEVVICEPATLIQRGLRAFENGAGNGIRTRDILLGRQALYH